MANHREYLADEITMIQSDNQVLKQENDLLRMTSERKAEENRILKEDLNALRMEYAEKVDEAAALRTILEGIGHNVSAGLTRFMERRALKAQHHQQHAEETKTAVIASYREEQSSDRGAEAYAPPAKRAEMEDAPPSFLQNRANSQLRPIQDSRIPMAPMSDAERTEAMRSTLR